jgi:hypothetical protein
MARLHMFSPFNGGNPLILAQRDDIPMSTLKILPYFTGETSISPLEDIQEVSNICSIHGVVRNKVSQPCIIPIHIICFVNLFFANNMCKCECTCLVGRLITYMCRHLEVCEGDHG